MVKNKRKIHTVNLIILCLFIVYLVLVLYMVFKPNQMGYGPNLNLQPFGDFLNPQVNNASALKQFSLNILMFVPIGFFLMLFTMNIKQSIIVSVLFSVFIESVQWVMNVLMPHFSRIVDIDDLLANSLGALIGIGLIYYLTNRTID